MRHSADSQRAHGLVADAAKKNPQTMSVGSNQPLFLINAVPGFLPRYGTEVSFARTIKVPTVGTPCSSPAFVNSNNFAYA